MKQYQEIEILLERFMEGRTSLGEEARLSEFFRQTPDLPSEWEPYREMFAYFENGEISQWYARRGSGYPSACARLVSPQEGCDLVGSRLSGRLYGVDVVVGFAPGGL